MPISRRGANIQTDRGEDPFARQSMLMEAAEATKNHQLIEASVGQYTMRYATMSPEEAADHLVHTVGTEGSD